MYHRSFFLRIVIDAANNLFVWSVPDSAIRPVLETVRSQWQLGPSSLLGFLLSYLGVGCFLLRISCGLGLASLDVGLDFL